jgi:hypothetical protein
MDVDYYSIITGWLKEQWDELTFTHLIYLTVFSFILSYVTEYVLKFKQIRWLYYSVSILLLIKLFEGGHPIGGVESVYKLILI